MCPPEEDALHARLLVVDDEPVIAQLVRLVFEQAGFVVTDAGDGTKAALLLQQERFDAAIIDKNLPGVDGVRLCALARERSKEMALVLMTAYATRESAAELLKVGIDDYVEKPFDLDALTERVKRILVRKRKVAHAASVVEAVRARRGPVRHGQVVDPCEAHRKAIEAALNDLGVEVHSGGEVAPDAIIDALVLSARLVDHALVDRLGAAREARPDLQVVVLSDRHSLDDDIAAIMVGACAEIAMPMDAEALRKALADGLGLARPVR